MVGKIEPFIRHGIEDKRIEISADEILNAIMEGKNIDIANAIIRGNIDIRIISDRLKPNIESDNILAILDRPTIKADIIIKHSEISSLVFFNSIILSGNVMFHEVKFGDEVLFDNVLFDKQTIFTLNNFNKGACFLETFFMEEADFYKSVFNSASFSHCFFHRVSFNASEFLDSVNFDYSHFDKEADFSNISFRDYTAFGYASFNDSAYFRATSFNGKTYFLGTEFRKSADFRSTTFEKRVCFASAKFGTNVLFNDATIKCPADFADVEFHENTLFIGLYNYCLRPILQHIVLFITRGKIRTPYGPEEHLPNGEIGQRKIDIGPSKIKITDFSEFNTNILMDGSTNPYLKRYIEDEQWINSWRKKSRGRRTLFYFWELSSHCGRSFGLWFFGSIVLAIIFGFLYRGHVYIDLNTADNWYTTFYFSIVTFTTLGFGDVKPIDWLGQVWVTLEVILGYLMLGGLISIFANKFARRS